MPFFSDLKLDLISWLRERSLRQRLPVFLSFLKPTKEDVILDVGSGTGVMASKVSALCDDVYALEPQQELVEYTKRKFPEVKAFQAFAENIQQFPASYFTKIYVVNAFHHFSDQEAALEEFHRILKQGGLLLINEMNPESRTAKMETRFSSEAASFVAPETLEEKLELAGFEIVRLEKTERQGYFALSRKI